MSKFLDEHGLEVLWGKIKQADNETVTSIMDAVNGLNTNFNIFKNSKGEANGLATLDAQGYVPLDLLGNLDTVLFEVVTNLPSALNKIKKHIYLKTSGIAGDKNVYAEYIYTGGITEHDVYDAAKWEKLGEVTANTDLSEYYKKTEVYNKNEVYSKDLSDNLISGLTRADIQNFTITPSSSEQGGSKLYYMQASITRKGADPLSATIPCVVSAANTTNANAGLMSPEDKKKLDGIAVGANNYTHPAHTPATKGLYKITVDSLGHVSNTEAVTKADITNLGIPGSAPTVDSAMSETSTNAVQNKVIDNAIKTHKIDNRNFDSIVNIAEGSTRLLLFNQSDGSVSYNDDNGACYLISNETIAADNYIPKLCYSEDGSTATSYLLRDIDIVALTDTELNEILK